MVVKESDDAISEAMEMNLTLVCDIIRANPNTLTKVRWFYDGQPLKVSHKTFIRRATKNKFSLYGNKKHCMEQVRLRRLNKQDGSCFLISKGGEMTIVSMPALL